MKKKLFFILLTTLVWGCKRKQNLREVSGSDVLAQGPVTCYNGVKDGDESYVDCGGSCIPCNFRFTVKKKANFFFNFFSKKISYVRFCIS